MRHADDQLLDKYFAFFIVCTYMDSFQDLDKNTRNGSGLRVTSAAGMARECIYNKSEDFIIETLNVIRSVKDNLKNYYHNNCKGWIDWTPLKGPKPTPEETQILIRWCKNQESFLSRKLAYLRKRKALGLPN